MFGNNGDWIWAFLLFALIGNNGWGGFGGGNNGYSSVLATDFATIERKIDGVNNGLCDGFYAQNTNMLNGFAGVQQTLCQGFSGVNASITDVGYAIKDCCCTTQRAIDSVKLENERNTCNIINASNANTRAILDYLTSEKISALQAENSGLKAQISNDRQSMYITDTILDRLSPCPKPSYFVPNPNCCYNYGVTPFGTCGASVQ
jgi:hypothetical protein